MSNLKNTPFPVTLITIFVLCISAWNAVRVYTVIMNWQILTKYGASPAYILATGVLWGLSAGWLFLVIHRKKYYALRANLIVAGLYYLWYWADRLFIQPSPAPNVIFSAVFSTAILLIFCILVITPAARTFFGKERA